MLRDRQGILEPYSHWSKPAMSAEETKAQNWGETSPKSK